jgi:hypothetical protein
MHGGDLYPEWHRIAVCDRAAGQISCRGLTKQPAVPIRQLGSACAKLSGPCAWLEARGARLFAAPLLLNGLFQAVCNL